MPTKSNSKKRELRIVFMGTPDFAVQSLDAIYEAGYNVVGVITAPDRPAGRGRKIQYSAVKKYSLEKGLPLLQPTNLKDAAFLNELKLLDANLQVVVAFRMLPKVVWQMPAYGTFNLHASLLPNYRGAAPINWAVINGEEETGITTFMIDEKIDTGQIILQEKVPIGKDETAGELHDTLMVQGAYLVVKTIELIESDTATFISQKEAIEINPAPKIHRDTCKINWNDDLDVIYNHIRGLSPYPTAWTALYNEENEQLLKLYEVQKENVEHKKPSGALVADKTSLKIAVKNGYISLEKVQLQGKRAMSVQELLNGLKLSKNAYVR
jgi:methionyl-tRNA formyltransferase